MDVNKLKGKVVEKGMNMSQLATKIGIDRSTLYRKLKSQGDTLTVKEVNLIVRALGLTKDEAVDIFFTNKVA